MTGITVHPRADARHITPADVQDVARFLADRPDVEFNIEGDPRPDLLAMVHQVRPAQCTLVPVKAGEITSQAGWPPDTAAGPASSHRSGSSAAGRPRQPVRRPGSARGRNGRAKTGAKRVELYTEPFARAFTAGPQEADLSFRHYAAAATAAHDLGLGVNAGHDLDLDNLILFRTLPHLDEVSIGHALISHALFVGLERAVREYLDACRL